MNEEKIDQVEYFALYPTVSKALYVFGILSVLAGIGLFVFAVKFDPVTAVIFLSSGLITGALFWAVGYGIACLKAIHDKLD